MSPIIVSTVAMLACTFMSACTNTPTAPAPITSANEGEVVIDGLWDLVKQDKPIEPQDVSKALNFNLDNYKNKSEKYSLYWKYLFFLKPEERNYSDTEIIQSVEISDINRDNSIVPRFRVSGKPLLQTTRINLRSPNCVDANKFSKRVGVTVSKITTEGSIHVPVVDLNVVSYATRRAESSVWLEDGCVRYITIRKAFSE